jgi:NAD(P)-dependent dehydrogenase (short-subunit alcohol dehydrogenase family)
MVMALNPPIKDWAGRRVWLVGASTGIGRATASALHALGASVIVSARNVDALNSFVAEHPGALSLPMDATDPPSVSNAFNIALAQGDLDCIVYCAGHYRQMSATSIDLPEMLRHWQTNYVGVLHLLKAVVPYFLSRPGSPAHISLIASVAGYCGLPGSLAYGPTKAALINLAEALYLDLQDHGIGVSLVNPGFVDTPLTEQNQFKMPALISSEIAAQEILHGWARGEFEIHFPKRFTYWMKVLKLLPYRASFLATRRFTHS